MQSAAFGFDAPLHVGFGQRRKVFGGQGGDAEEATGGFYQELFFFQRAIDSCLRGQVSDDVQQFGSGDSNCARVLHVQLMQEDL